MSSQFPLYHVTDIINRDAILRDGIQARSGFWKKTQWKPRVFFATTRIGALELAQMFIWERRGESYVLFLVDPGRLRGKLRPDKDYDQGVWTARGVTPDAIIGVEDLDEGCFESREFLTYMGIDPDEE